MQSQIEPRVSVVIPCYNHSQFVQDCIQSVIDQTYVNIELIIIDDGSKDDSVAKIQEMLEVCQARFTRFEFKHRPNKGLSATLNEALEWCQGEYFSAIASDDMMLAEKTRIQVGYLQKNKKCVAVFGGYDLINDKGQAVSNVIGANKVYNFSDIIMHQHDLPAPTQMIVLSALKEVNGYPKGIIIEDWYMWLKLSEKSQIHYISKKIALYRSHGDNISKKINIMHEGRLQVLSHYDGHPLFPKALLQAKWITLSELRAIHSSSYLLNLLKFSLQNPRFFFKKIYSRYLK